MKITRKNYEIFFIDYLDGTLGPAGKTALMNFLDKNRDLQKELNEFEGLKIHADDTEFTWKKELKKKDSEISLINESNFEKYCIAKVEGDLDPHEEIALDHYIRGNPDRMKQLDLYMKSRLQPGNYTFPDKGSLKKHIIAVRNKYFVWYFTSAAASILIIFTLAFMFTRNQLPREERVTLFQPDTGKNIEADDGQIPIVEVSGEPDVRKEISSEPASVENIPEFNNLSSRTAEVAHSPIVELTKENNPELFPPGESRIPSDNLTDLSRREWGGIELNQPEISLAVIDGETNLANETDYLSLGQKVLQQLKNNILDEEQPASDLDRLTFLDLADAGVRGINRLTGSDLQLHRVYDEKGDLTAYEFNSKALSFSHKRKNEK